MPFERLNQSGVSTLNEREKALLVHVDLPGTHAAEELSEFHHLVTSSGAEVVSELLAKRHTPDPATYIGSGKVEELRELVESSGADIVLFNHALSPGQERNLERAISVRVLDRTGLILDIFALRARTHEGRLQVELAQLQHRLSRLVKGRAGLDGQKGGIGMRGPGEMQLETDRRLIRQRISGLEKNLAKVRRQRAQGRRARERAETPLISIVGYTNAGKSTLFNRLTEAEVYVADQLFATLDPTLRRVRVAGVGPAILADTVGFIRHLPHRLVESFRSTLEETLGAGLLLHVTDAAAEDRQENIASVEGVRSEIEADELPVLHVYNKADLLDEPVRIDRDEEGKPWRVWVSAVTGEGMDLLYEAMAERIAEGWVDRWVLIPVTAGRLRAQLHDAGEVLAEKALDDGALLARVRVNKVHFAHLLRSEGLTEEEVAVSEAVAEEAAASYNSTYLHNTE